MSEQICEYCGKINESNRFFIGASTEPSWTMHEGTGKLSCPECYPKAHAEAQKLLVAL